MSRLSFVIVLLSAALSGCASTAAVRTAMVDGDQQRIDRFVNDFFAGRTMVDRAALMDDRPVAGNLLVRVEDRSRISQYRVELVSDVFMCLLQMKGATSTRDILDLNTDSRLCPGEDTCEVCNSLVYPLAREVRERLREYWLQGM
jgi:hypothetical protein